MTNRVIGHISPRCRPERAGATARASRRIYGLLRSLREVLAATIHEIFDESAYERYLARTQDTRSAASYSAFVREQEAAIPHKPRCC